MRFLARGIAALLLLASWGAQAAVTPNSIVSPQTPTVGVVQFLQGTDSPGTYKTIYSGGTNGSRCSAVWSTNNDASATHLLTIQIVRSAVKYGGMAITTVVNAGFANAVPAQNLISSTVWPGLPTDGSGNPFVMLASGDTLQGTFATALTATDVINVAAICADY